MYTRMSVFASLFLVIAILPAMPLAADEPLRGLVVDRGDKVLWLGFPAAAQKGMVFNVSLLPGNNVIARAEVVEATPDAPYVAKASFTMLDKQAFIPIGAYVEASDVVVADRDKSPGYKAIFPAMKETNPLSLTAGVLFLSNKQLQNETDQVWPALQLDYRLSKSGPIEASLGVGFFERHGTFTVGTTTRGRHDLQVIPVTIDAKLRLSEQCGQSGWFGKAGAGAFIVRDKRVVGTTSKEANNTTIGWRAGIGYESAGGRSVELGYVDACQRDFKGTTFTLGARF